MERLIYCKTDKGHYAVRPLNWAGCWNDKGEIKEFGLNHTAIFASEEEAKHYVEMNNAEEQST